VNILVLAAHPDDETLGCGGTVAKLSNEGHNIHLITFTDGGSARIAPGDKADRRHTIQHVSELLGIKSYKSFDFPDNAMDTVALIEIIKAIEQYTHDKDMNPDIVFTHSPYCLNIDHRIVYNATITAFRGLACFNPIKILAYEVPSSSEWNPISNFLPNCYFDITKTLDKKLEALKIYSDEMRSHPHPRSLENCRRLAMIHGAESGLDAAERFMILREVIK
jgi:N-acetylglucosamine malate deacetylase 1